MQKCTFYYHSVLAKKKPYCCTRDDYQVSFVEWPFIIVSKYCYLSLDSDTKEGSNSIFLDNLQVQDKKQVNKCVKKCLCVCIICEHISISCYQQFMHGCFHMCRKITHTSAYKGMISAKLMPCVISCRHFFNEHISKKIASFDLSRYMRAGVFEMEFWKSSYPTILLRAESARPCPVTFGMFPLPLWANCASVRWHPEEESIFLSLYEFPVF